MVEQAAGVKDRRFFRLQDRVYFACRRMDGEPAPAIPAGGDADPLLELPDKLSALTHESRPIFRRLVKDNAEVAAAIAILDKKINLLAAALIAGSLGDSGPQLRDVSLSASGVGFASEQPWPVGASVLVTLLLPPSLFKIAVRGRIVVCRPNDETPEAGAFWVGVDFCEIDERDQEFLTSHVLKKQAEEIKHQRDLEATGYAHGAEK